MKQEERQRIRTAINDIRSLIRIFEEYVDKISKVVYDVENKMMDEEDLYLMGLNQFLQTLEY